MEILLIGLVLGCLVASVVGLARRRRSSEPPVAAAGERDANPTGSWTAGAVGAAFPLERTPHERDIGDAAFVDGLVVGRYVFPDERVLEKCREDPPPDPGGEGDDAAEFDAVGPTWSADDDGAEEEPLDDPFAPGLEGGSGDDLDDGFDDGFHDGFEEFDDDW